MENMYGVGVTNRYALFLSEEDPLEKLKAKEKAKEEKKKKQPLGAEKENKGAKTPAVKNKPTVKVANGIKDNQNVKPDSQPKEDATAKPKKPEKVKFNDESKLQTDIPKENVTDNLISTRKDNNTSYYSDTGDTKERRYNGEGGRGRGGGMARPPRGARGGRGGRGGGRREFDRQSGSDRTGFKATTKRNGGGPHNWGADGDEIEEQTIGNPSNDVSGDWGNQDGKLNDSVTNNEGNLEKAADAPAASGSGGDDATAPSAATEAEDQAAKEITLDEWKATRGSKLIKPQYNLRKPGEGEDLTRWQGMYELKGKKEEARLIEEEKAANEIAAKTPKKKEVVDTNFHFADQPTRGGRGKGRGGMRGDRGPRDKPSFPRGPRNTPRVDVNNEHDFPSLG